MVVIRLARGGAKKRPFYYVVAADKRRARDCKYIERLGFYNPLAASNEVGLQMERDKIAAWVAKGAQISAKVKVLMQDLDKKSAA